MQKPIADLVFQGFIIVIVGIGVIQALGWKYETGLLPYTVGGIVLVLAGINFVRELIVVLKNRPAAGQGDASPQLLDAGDVTKKSLLEIVWLAGYALGIFVLGFYPGTFVYLAAFFQRRAKMALVRSLIAAVLTTGAIYVVFHMLFKIPVYKGLMATWF